MTEYFCQRLCVDHASEPTIDLQALSVCELDGSETLLLCLLTGLAFAIFVYVYRYSQSQGSGNSNTTLTTNQLQCKRLVTPPNPTANVATTLDTTYTLHHFQNVFDRTITLPNGSFDGQWLILSNTGEGTVILKCRMKDGRNVEQPGIILRYGSSGVFIWLDPFWCDATVGFSIM